MKLLMENWRGFLDEEECLEEAPLEEGVADWVKEKWQQLKNVKQRGMLAAAQEWRETKEVAPILKRLITGEEVSPEEKRQLNDQARYAENSRLGRCGGGPWNSGWCDCNDIHTTEIWLKTTSKRMGKPTSTSSSRSAPPRARPH